MISNEKTLVLDDFKRYSAPHLGLWVLASCEIYPFDSKENNLADVFLFRPNAGAVAFMCATRAVYATQNNALNIEFCKRLFTPDTNGRLTTMGEALRQAKNELISSQSDLTINMCYSATQPFLSRCPPAPQCSTALTEKLCLPHQRSAFRPDKW